MADEAGPRSHIDKSTVISIGVAIALGAIVFMFGSIHTKVDYLAGLSIERRLSRIEAILEAKSKAAAFPFSASCCLKSWDSPHRRAVPESNATSSSENGPNVNWQIWHSVSPIR